MFQLQDKGDMSFNADKVFDMFHQHEVDRITSENLKHKICVSGKEFEGERDAMRQIEALNDVCHLKIKKLKQHIKNIGR